jgi:predicted TIM-barrel fold metal-dependent hydrolase
MPGPPGFAVPPNACDAHTHVFGPPDSFPTGPSSYPIPLADPATHRRALDAMGVGRAVLVQPAPYGTDTAALEHALRAGGGRLAGIAAADAAASDADLWRLHVLGVRGLRFNERIDPRTGRRYGGAIGTEALAALAPRMRELGWHAQLWAGLGDCLRIADEFGGCGVPLVFDHLAHVDPARGTGDPAFRRLVELVRGGAVWVKLTVCRVSSDPGFEDLRAHHEVLLDANPDRLLWGSDWPYVAMGERAPDAGRLLGLFARWAANENLIHRVLVDNPQQLFRWENR